MKGWFFPLERVEQADDHGCAIATVATVCGITYSRARREFFPLRRFFDDDRSLCVRLPRMVEVIRNLGFSARFVYPSFKHLGVPVILPFQWMPGLPRSGVHCVVWDPTHRRMIDPGPDCRPVDAYVDLWKRSKFNAIAVTGRR